MSYDLQNMLVVGLASSALFDLTESDAIFQSSGEEAYRKYQEEHIDGPLAPGVAFPFTKRLLSLNMLVSDKPLVEVIVLSRNDPDTGLRVMRSIRHHKLPISRAIFTQGQSPYRFMPALNMSLFLSANQADVAHAVSLNLPAGRVVASTFVDDDDDELRVAFDFDGVLADDSSERVMQTEGLESFHEFETVNVKTPHKPGPLRDLLEQINKIQKVELDHRKRNPSYKTRLRVSIVTARNAPSHERAIESLKSWGVTVNDGFFLGGIKKGSILHILRPHIFFDDQVKHLESTAQEAPSVHIPFGITNEDE